MSEVTWNGCIRQVMESHGQARLDLATSLQCMVRQELHDAADAAARGWWRYRLVTLRNIIANVAEFLHTVPEFATN